MRDGEDWAERLAQGAPQVSGVFKNVIPAGSGLSGIRIHVDFGSFFLFTLRGQALLRAGSADVPLHPGTVLHGGPGLAAEWLAGDLDFEYCLVCYTFPAAEFGGASGGESAGEPKQFRTENHARLVELLRKLHHAAGTPGPLAAFRVKELFYSVLSETFSGSGVRVDVGNKSIMEQAIQFIHDRYREPLTLRELANLHGMGAKPFSELFRRYAGMEPMVFLEQRRLKRAQELLATSECGIGEVASSVGFADAFEFARRFRQLTGRSPEAFREAQSHVKLTS